ncbi:Uncharacterised protein [Salmonella enterica subsp. enterica serovar Bovismorbificans]|nr:Uncharacterised protein [Salmonella enterica subsp. enterica serovar Bovismorbificans]CPR48732.1 Uncharacterised protein [Salmonella enterica subsp. enterica serovar Bovismorbificans]
MFTFQRISNACNQRFRQQPFKTGFAELLPYLQTNAVARLRFNSVKSRGGHYFSFIGYQKSSGQHNSHASSGKTLSQGG